MDPNLGSIPPFPHRLIYEEVSQALNGADVRYLVVGGIAVNLHGVPRATADLGIDLALDQENVLAAVGVIEALGFEPRAPVQARDLGNPQTLEEWVREKGMRASSFHDSRGGFRELDLVMDHRLDFEKAWARRKVERAGDIEVPVASIEDLIALKQGTGRAQDESDIEALERLRRM